MTVTIQDPVVVSSTEVWVSWSSDLADPRFDVYLDGELVLEQTLLTSRVFSIPAVGSARLEVLDDSGVPAARKHASRATIAWFAVSATTEYRVEQLVGGDWEPVETVLDRGEGYYRVVTRPLADVTEHEFRVVAVAQNLNETETASLTILIVRHPDPPLVQYSYDEGTQELTVDAA